MKKARHLKVLCIDDNLEYQAITARHFAILGGHMVFSAVTGEAGLLQAAEIQPDIILLDMQLPDMNGMEVMMGLTKNTETQSIPVIIVTGNHIPTDLNTLQKEHRNLLSLEEKPVSAKKLLNTIEHALLGQESEFTQDPTARCFTDE